ncbi:MAG: hypothetical protein ACD_30C00049G0026 [uncultured bacterium]|uniref:Cytidylate kinase n=4 Tax=Candidatus Daviesiibacteriota TaxID=1752718 RepID=A0A0G0EUT8_9BACT|nr:MAG: hypothetical protein ACD_30C00049G0026 [uncultured bacterium]KKQ10678.1 MAG: Cytidylate kinase [Candidatus Daviesbacteria bacterium GW2011_GWB1_36_5]KKQ15000.1 MAG: Cytidylate kinase [Candidatus Daviesbacteria bacterium GW2011_GWA1_36_8]OGE16844.1 MAG: cytidylate kinase [Candidatus Daviesbacteria bacterium RIFCSPHIGHO2_01_FULL_36_37]OGE31202.1 MAG: cytidylate kinase [Candidatus Daviesbacteria bacterium RIFCSPHIGHO2_02_FULL_37_9]OGE35832.1 MAG: cytidylate kinase [Candidatus Daviesbacter
MSEVITIDGPTSSGKSSVGHLFSANIGFQFIDTGAIYRAGSLFILENNLSTADENVCAKVFENLNVEFKEIDGSQRIFLDGKDITEKLHLPQVTKVVPIIAAFPKVRELSKKIQRKIGSLQNTVMTGRDIGTEIFPDSKLKIFLTASPEIRAKRRYEQLKQKDLDISYEKVLEEMLKRDEADSIREASPFRKPDDAVEIDTTNLTTKQTVEKMLELFKARGLS